MPYIDPITKRTTYAGGEALPAIGSPEYNQAQQAPVVPTTNVIQNTSTPSPTYPPTNLDRSPGIGLLAQQKENLASVANSYESARQQADQYAAQMRQARIDAINTAFAPRIQREQEAGDARLARVAALNFKQGTIGSGIDTTKTEGQKTANKQALQSIEDEKATAIQSAFEYADQLARQRTEDTYSSRVKGAEANVASAQDRYDTAVKSLQSFGKGGTTLENLKAADPDTYNNLREVGGLSDLQIASIMNEASPQPSNVSTTFKDGYLISSYFDPLTKKFKTYTEKLDLPEGVVEKDITTVQGDNGLIYAIDKKTGQVVNTIGERNPLYGTRADGKSGMGATTPEGIQAKKAELASTYALANEIANKKDVFGNPLTNTITGAAKTPWLPGRAYLQNQLGQLQSLLSLDSRQKLKGSGAISDFEFKVLNDSVSALGLRDTSYTDAKTGQPVKGEITSSLSNADFQREMKKVRGALGTASGLAMPVKVTDPKTGEVKDFNLDTQAITDATNQGYIVEYQ